MNQPSTPGVCWRCALELQIKTISSRRAGSVAARWSALTTDKNGITPAWTRNFHTSRPSVSHDAYESTSPTSLAQRQRTSSPQIPRRLKCSARRAISTQDLKLSFGRYSSSPKISPVLSSCVLRTSRVPVRHTSTVAGPPRAPNPQDVATLSFRDRLRLWEERRIASAEHTPALHGRFLDLDIIPPKADGETKPLGADDLVEREEDEFEDDEDIEEHGELLSGNENRPGDLIEILIDQKPILGMYLRIGHSKKIQVYTMDGRVVAKSPHQIRHTASRFFSNDMVDKILEYIPDEETISAMKNEGPFSLTERVPRAAGSAVVKKLRKFWDESDQIYREKAPNLEQAHMLMADQDQTILSTLSDITRVVLRLKRGIQVNETMLYAVHRTLRQDASGFTQSFVRGGKATQSMFWIQSKRQRNTMLTARDWIREYQESQSGAATDENSRPVKRHARGVKFVEDFIKKARKLTKQSRAMRTAIAPETLGPLLSALPEEEASSDTYLTKIGEAFSKSDQAIIELLYSFASGLIEPISDSSLAAAAALITRAVGVYNDDIYPLDKRQAHKLLQEIGVLPPWEQPSKYFQLANIINRQQEESKMQELEALVSTMDLKDSLKSIRTDVKDMDVYCIDAEGTNVIDDGISLERIDGSCEYWVHTHVANPTAFIPPDHPIALNALGLASSRYTPSWAFQMLPRSLPENYLNLDSGRPAITFSARVTANGEILDTKITPSTLGNVIRLSPRAVADILGIEDTSEEFVVTVGKTKPENPNKCVDLSQQQIEDLQTIRQLADSMVNAGVYQKSIGNSSNRPSISVYPKDVPVWKPNQSEAIFYQNDPAISLRTFPNQAYLRPPQNPGKEVSTIVETYMVLAGVIAANYCVSRSIPILYRTSQNAIEGRKSEYDAFLENTLKPLFAAHESLPQFVIKEYFSYVGVAKLSSKPFPNLPLGLKMYTRCTSPLRRFEDMIIHYQIQEALLIEAETGEQFSTTDRKRLPYSRNKIDEMGGLLSDMASHISIAQAQSIQHWAAQLLYRAVWFEQAELPSTFEFSVTEGPDPYADIGDDYVPVTGKIPQLNLVVKMLADQSQREMVQKGDIWRVRFRTIAEITTPDTPLEPVFNTYSGRPTVVPVELVSRFNSPL